MTHSSLNPTCVWIFDGGPDTPAAPTDETPPTCVIAVDSGLDHALSLGFTPSVLIGDRDSVSDAGLRQWQEQWQLITARTGQEPLEERHKSEKNESDLELALIFASKLRPRKVVVLSGGAGRLDHLLIGTLGLANWAKEGFDLKAYVGSSLVLPLAQGDIRTLDLTPDSVLTLLAVGGPAQVNTDGLRWNLTSDYTLLPGSSRGLSNKPARLLPVESGWPNTKQTSTEQAQLHVKNGTVLAIVSPLD